MRLAAITSMMVAIICLSIVLLTGYLGQVSLAQLTLVGFSAFMLARAAGEWGLPFPLAPLAAVVATTALGVLISLPALRIRGIQVAIVTLAAAVAIEQLLFRNPTFAGRGGLSHVDPPELFGARFGIMGAGRVPVPPVRVLRAGAAAGRRGPGRRACAAGRIGRRMLAVRANERAAAASGIGVAGVKLQAAALSSLIAALGGLVFAYKNVDFSWSGLEASRGLQLLALAYLGGVTTVSGALIAGVLAPSGLLLVRSARRRRPASSSSSRASGCSLVTVRFPSGLAGAGPWARRQLRRAARPSPGPGRADPRSSTSS